ncbi:ABC transporter substrate-binding protein [Marihabitans asiaticum]|uniref:Iron complex transport system substrate-binding protein n=1 Tax=Marihabitans asiaticum TaxID=415218 RepID=A0A560WED3_9MICO|nr:ABC transporter substrate-binding protein [Marihabitans asiaticum]TWD15946.1 iron complex transport system substrate-binding protein [Marihabitans asiaticum]
MSPLRTALTTGTGALAALTLAACGSGADSSGEASTASDDGHYPVTITSCGEEMTFESEPQDVVMLKSAWVPFLSPLGVLDHVTAKAGAYPEGYYDEETTAQVEQIEVLTDRVDSSGHLIISKEAVLEREPDLVLGHTEGLDAASMGEVGVPLLEVQGLCSEGQPDPSFEQLYGEIEDYGAVFNREDEAAAAVEELRERVGSATEQAGAGGDTDGEDKSVAILYPTVGGGTTYAYGSRSMPHVQSEAAGLTNVYGDVDKRVFEITPESLLEENPDVLVLLYSEGDPSKVEDAVTELPGADRLAAVQDGEILTQLFNFSEPASPIAVDGLEQLVERFGSE